MNDAMTNGRELVAHLNRELAAAMIRDRTVPLDRVIAMVSRELRPFLRNRFEVRNTSTTADARSKRLRIAFFDHARGCRVDADQVVFAARDIVA